ncbi:hypothetical protein [Streptomyces sp. 7N604]|uniref:hypothetical protein n=1 Tax=Streptomyces sp. 7N604 TaxID=3457415 RepID=UPI003FD6838E
MPDTGGPGQQAPGVHVAGGNSGQLIVGNNNVIFNGNDIAVEKRTGPAPEVRPRSRPTGRPLPRSGPELTGRDDELAQLEQWVDEGIPVQLVGPPGIGKTALLHQYAARCAAAGSDVVFLDAAGLDAEDVLQELFQACYDVDNYRPDPTRLRRLMRSIRALVVIDDFTGSAAELRTLLDTVPSSVLVIASTTRSLRSKGRAIELTGLQPGPALALLEHELGRPLAGDERCAAEEFRQAVGGHPLALIQAAAAISTAAAADVPGDQRELAQALATGLNPEDHAVLGLLLCLEGIAVPRTMVEMLSGTAPISGIVDRLRRARLIVEDPEGLRALAPAARLVAESPAPSRARVDVEQAAAALADWAATAEARTIGAANAVVVRVLDTAVASGAHATAVKLARTVAPALCRTLRWGAWRRVLALGKRAAHAAGSTDAVDYFDREENARRRALGIGSLVGVAAGGGFIFGRHLATKKAVGSGAKGCLLSPGAIGAGIAVVIATIMGFIGYTSVSDPGPDPSPAQPRAIEFPSFPHRPGEPTRAVTSRPPSSPKPTGSQRPGLTPTASSPPSSRFGPSAPPSEENPSARSSRPEEGPGHVPPSQTSLPSVEGFWGKEQYQIEFPMNSDGRTWSNIVLTYVQDGTWEWRYDCWTDTPVSNTAPGPVDMECDVHGGEPFSKGRVTHTSDDSVELVVDDDPDVSGIYHRTKGFES